ncbi:MAG TPA: N-acetyltransferase [Candidatus Jeotgalibaca pullicola]|nr:N-acetyltransferase [Candidatus Jeotgalibaca pullicola]
MKIRKAKEAELDRLIEIWLESSFQAHDFIDQEYWEENREVMRNLYLPLSENFVVIEGTIKGFLSMMGKEIAALFILPSEQGVGFGKALMQYAQEKNNEIYLNVYAQNERAKAFYQSQDFQIVEKSLDAATNEIEYRMHWESGR